MELADLLNADPNTLPYFITEVQTRRKVLVRFEPLAPDDDAELRGSVWSQSIFAAVWQHYMGDGRTYKLVCIEEADKRIQGIVCVGSIAQNATLLRENLLESAPFNQKTYRSQEYRGVGRVLVARLVVESYLQGGKGRVAVKPRQGTERFYMTIGFRKQGNFILEIAEAQTLLGLTLIQKEEQP